MNFKRIFAIVLTLLILLLTACTVNDTAPDVTKPSTTQEQTIASVTSGTTADLQTDSQTITTSQEDVTSDITSLQEDEPDIESEAVTTSETESVTNNVTEIEPEDEPEDELPVVYGEYYYDVVNVVLYLEIYGELPPNYITKNEARDLGWTGGSVERYRDGAAIGGDYFGNYEGLLPTAKGRKYTECDIDTNGYSSRGSRRLIFSNDGLYFYTSDHYESFAEVTVTEDYEVIW